MTDDAYPRCTLKLRARGLVYPRTCAECGLGPCKTLASAPHPAPDATDWKARCEAAEKHAGAQADYILLLRDENEKLRAALIAAREAILSLRDTRWSEAEGTDDEWVGYIDYALSPPPLSPEQE